MSYDIYTADTSLSDFNLRAFGTVFLLSVYIQPLALLSRDGKAKAGMVHSVSGCTRGVLVQVKL